MQFRYALVDGDLTGFPYTLDSEEEPFVREMAKRRNALSQAGVENPAPGRRIGTDSH